jgi:hypothetical protein
MDGGSADHAGAVICRPAGDHPLFDLHRCHTRAGDRPRGGLLQRLYWDLWRYRSKRDLARCDARHKSAAAAPLQANKMLKL